MSDELIEDSDLDTSNEEVDDTLEVEEIEETPEGEEIDVVALQESRERIYKRAKAAEAELKALKANKPVEAKTQSTNIDNSSDTVDEKILKSTKGYDEETIDKLKVVAKGLGVDLFKAEQDDLFQDYIAKKQADERKEKAKLGSSKGSQVSQERSIGDLTDEEHKQFVKEQMSKVN